MSQTRSLEIKTAATGERALRVGLVGAGMISAFHLAAWRARPDARVVAIADPDLAAAERRASEYAVPVAFDGLAALLDAVVVDAVDIVAPRAAHDSLVRLAVAHGVKNIMCQKPLAGGYDAAKRLMADIDGRARLMVHENFRFRPPYRRLRAWIDAGRLGELLSATLAVRGSGLLPDAEGRLPALERQPFFRTEPRLLVAETLVHHLDVLRWLFGPLRVLAARTIRASEAVVGESIASILLETSDGKPLHLEGNLVCAGFPARSDDALQVFGSRASVAFERFALAIHDATPEREVWDPVTAYQASFDGAIGDFVARVRDGGAFETDIADNLETLRLVDDVYRAAGAK
jgi:predicted dehydrogenase